jgi:hypothetical protein
MNARQALARLVSLRVPGAIEAVDNCRAMPTPFWTWLPSRPPYRSASHGFVKVLDETARLTDLNVPVATQKRFAVQTMFSLGTMSWDENGQVHGKRFSKEAKRLFETFVGFVFYKHRRLHTSVILLTITIACILGRDSSKVASGSWPT